MPERQPVDKRILKKEIVEGRMFALQIKKKSLSLYKLAALNSGSTLEVIADKTGEKYPARIRFERVLKTRRDKFKSVKFYEWQVGINIARAGNIVIAIKNPEGEKGFLKFWQEHNKLGKQALKTPAKVVKTPTSK